jgi:hypothetical protein
MPLWFRPSKPLKLEVSFTTPLHLTFDPSPTPTPKYRGIFTFTMGQLVFRGENMSNTMQTGTYATLSIEWVDDHGNPAKVDGATEWASSDESIATITVATGNPLIANVQSVGPIGPVQMQATADADLGDGVKTITATCDISVIAGEASGGEIKFTQSPAQGGGRIKR